MYDVSWKLEYEIGNSLIDREHKYLFTIAQEAFKPISSELRKKKIRDTVVKLNEYMKIHFKHEEQFMYSINYPYLKEHRVIHNNIIDTVQSMLATLSTTSLKQFEYKLIQFIDVSLVKHILDEDAKIQQWFQTKKGQKDSVRWSEKYTLGNKKIDKEHKGIFKLANDAFFKSKKGVDKIELKKIVVELLSSFKSHFENEEKMMEDINYEGIYEHKETHNSILHRIEKFIKDISDLDRESFDTELAFIIEKQLVNHILEEDMKIKYFLESADGMSVILDDMP